MQETILVVEDEAAVRQLAVQALTRAGYRVHQARDGLEAVHVFDEHGDTIDLLLTDIRMPHMSGAELAHYLRARRPAVKLLCISGYADHETQTLDAAILAKPFSLDTLLTKVRQVLDTHT